MTSPRGHGRHEGFALLALLGVLLAGASVAALFTRSGPSRPLEASASADARRLVLARDALLAYTAGYPELYGPTGAGPGHLPCPDTDDAYRLAGPNPPCGRGDIAVGKLPEHVTVAGTRVGLDARIGREPIRYRLDARAANNPARHGLVSAWRSGALAGDAPMATLSLGEGGPSLHLRVDALMRAAERRVAAWVVAHAAPPSGDDVPDVLSLVTRATPAPEGEGESVAPPIGLVQGVPPSRHWFVADGWAETFAPTVRPACSEAPGDCRWRLDGRERSAEASSGRVERPRIRLAFAPRPEPRLEPGAR